MKSAIFSPMSIEVRFVFARMQSGILDASATLMLRSPLTFPNWSRTAMLSLSGPILHVPDAWWLVLTRFMMYSVRSLSDCATSVVGAISSSTMSE